MFLLIVHKKNAVMENQSLADMAAKLEQTEKNAKACIAIYEAMCNPFEYSYTRKAAELCGFTSFDAARPQQWSDNMRAQGCGDLLQGVVWDYSTDKFGKPVNIHAELFRAFSRFMEDSDTNAIFVAYVASYVDRFGIRQYLAENNLPSINY